MSLTQQLLSTFWKACAKNNFCVKLRPNTFYLQRHFSLKSCKFQKHLEELNFLSGLTKYVNKEMYLFEPKPLKDETLTIRQLLDECKLPTDVLALIGDMHQLEKLWNDELVYYLIRLAQLTCFNQTSFNDEEISISEVINNCNFHVLLRKIILISPCMKSTDLVFCFHSAANLMIPANSFVITRLVEVMQQRINDFFPKDVAICHLGLLKYQFQTQSMLAMQNGLTLHLENIAKDESFFVKTAISDGLKTTMNLSKYYGPSASPQLRKCLFSCVNEYVKRFNTEENISNDMAVKVLASLSGLRYYHKPLVSASLKALLSNPGQLSFLQQASLSKSFKYLNISFTEQETALLKEKFSDSFHKMGLSA